MSKLIGLIMVRNESWILGFSLRVAMAWCDEVIVLNHGADEGVNRICLEVSREEGSKPLQQMVHADVDRWDEMDLRQSMLECGRRMGGTHFAIIDGDEAVTANRLPQIRAAALRLEPGQCLATRMVSPWHSLDRHRADNPYHNGSCLSLAFADRPEATWKPAADGYQFHARLPKGIESQPASPLDVLAPGGVFHFQTVSRRRLVVKAAWYKCLELIMFPGRTTPERLNEIYDWQIVNEEAAEICPVPPRWWAYPDDSWRARIAPNEEPWQLAGLMRMIQGHDLAKFVGVNFHEIAQEVLPCGSFDPQSGLLLSP